jgi:hypothetical protein
MRRYRKKLLKWLAISLMCLYFGFMVGKFKQDILENEIQLLELETANLNIENKFLIKKLTLLQADFFSEKEANAALNAANKALYDELDTSQNKLYFYEQVVAPELAETGLGIYSFKVHQTANQGDWFYEIVLTQDHKRRRLLHGYVDIIFDRSDDNDEVSHPISLSHIDKSFNNAFKFKYFQTLKGQFTLPKDAKVDQIFVVAQANGDRWNKAQRIEKIYDWKDFIDMGGLELKELEIQE